VSRVARVSSGRRRSIDDCSIGDDATLLLRHGVDVIRSVEKERRQSRCDVTGFSREKEKEMVAPAMLLQVGEGRKGSHYRRGATRLNPPHRPGRPTEETAVSCVELRTRNSHPPTLLHSIPRACVRWYMCLVSQPKLIQAQNQPGCYPPLMLKYSGGRASERASEQASGRARGTGIARENYGRLRESNNSLIRGRVYVAHVPFYRMPFVSLPLFCAHCNFCIVIVDLIICDR